MEFLIRNINSAEFLTYILIGCFGLLALIKTLYQNQFSEFLAFLFNGKYLLLHNKKELKSNFFNSFFYLFFSLNASVFGVLVFKHLNLFDTQTESIELTLKIFLGINVFFIAKYLIEKLVFETTDLNSFYENIHFQRLTLINYVALVLFILNLLTLFAFPNQGANYFYISLSLIGLLYLITLAFLLIHNQKVILKHSFYFILYLCAFEISPVLLGAIWLKTNL